MIIFVYKINQKFASRLFPRYRYLSNVMNPEARLIGIEYIVTFKEYLASLQAPYSTSIWCQQHTRR